MHDIRPSNQSAFLLQIFDNLSIRILRSAMSITTHLDVLALILWHFRGKLSNLVDGTWRDLIVPDDLVRNSNPVIVFSKGRRLVDDTGTGCIGDIGVGQYSESPVLVLTSARPFAHAPAR
jgi:hypothetical protein